MTALDELPERWRRDRLVRSEGVRLVGSRMLADEEALVTIATGPHGTSVAGYGDRGSAARRVGELVGAGELRGPLRWLTLPRDTDLEVAVAADLGVEPLPGWDWLSVDAPPRPQPGERDVVRLDPSADADAVRACLAASNPGTDADPDGPHEVAWWGVRADGDDLLGVIGASGRGGPRPTWHLHGLGVRPSARRRGLGRALTAKAVRDGLAAGAPWVSLGVWADNEPALAMYAALGFRTDHRRRSYRPVGEVATHPRG